MNFKHMKKLPFFVLATGLIIVSCTRRFECQCDYKQRSFSIDTETGDTLELRKDTIYLSYISYTSKKLATEECDERGRSLMLDSLKIEASCGVIKFKQ
jgi:hypothetical protein